MSLSDKSFILEDNQAKLFINLELYSLNAVKKTAYKFASQCSILLEGKDEQKLCILFTFLEPTVSDKIQQVVADFCDELIDQDLREIIAKETEAARNLILAQAFSKTSLIN
ncbi:MAG: His-Xaa-Ser system protein HxsD [Nostoc sp. DedQUE04]|uniref:His-Xaa-Ser system protein HxsD n=1 Tax=Nostoc sp. DedQUE04 TaxID=3075390 RepID=UPI002AD2CC5C|nr:His-Xaa-Ser system protein HxsD [Nostoc sp. DedQUE04]MDZ8135778.1 His-Xaa-Ser system protein HxsD [Nostoc sp. DedQUE04]